MGLHRLHSRWTPRTFKDKRDEQREKKDPMLTVLLLELLMATPLTLQGPGVPAGVHTFEDTHWEHRVLLVFPGPDASAWRQQRERLDAARDALAERDILVVVVGDTPAPIQLPQADAARARWKVGPAEAQAVLVGKDGGEKWRAALPTPLEPVFELVDTMPMRQREVRERRVP
jgi:hypothetical protein